jgi:hypothetical protein
MQANADNAAAKAKSRVFGFMIFSRGGYQSLRWHRILGLPESKEERL